MFYLAWQKLDKPMLVWIFWWILKFFKNEKCFPQIVQTYLCFADWHSVLIQYPCWISWAVGWISCMGRTLLYLLNFSLDLGSWVLLWLAKSQLLANVLWHISHACWFSLPFLPMGDLLHRSSNSSNGWLDSSKLDCSTSPVIQFHLKLGFLSRRQ